MYSVRKEEIPDHNRRRKKDLVEKGEAHGILVYDRTRAVGWCAYGLQREFPARSGGVRTVSSGSSPVSITGDCIAA